MLHLAVFSASARYRGEGQRSVGNLYHFGILTFLRFFVRGRDIPIYLPSFRGISLRDISAVGSPLGDIQMILTRCISPNAHRI